MGLTLLEFRDLLRIDLKDSGSVWSDPELNRSVQRAVDDLSRSLPLEKVYEETLDFNVDDESITTPAAASATAIVNAVTLDGETNGATLSIADLTPDVPRRLTITLTDANRSVTELTITVKGYDQNGFYIEESWYLSSLVIGEAKQGNLYFSRIQGVIVTHIGTGASAADTISVGTGNAYDSYISLANKPIKPETETVTNAAGTTKYTRDTDYTMDYINGGIKFISDGNMAAGTDYLIDYTKSRLGISISSILSVVTRIQRVEYPTDLIPQQFVSFNILGDFLYIASKVAGQSQEEFMSGSGKHIAIYYEQAHMPPAADSPGSYPSVLDEVIAIGAAGYALLIEAQQYEQQAVTDLTSIRTELGLTTDIHTLAAAALDKVITYLEDNTSEDAKSWLTKITTDIAGLRTSLLTAVDAANAYLDEVDVTDLGQAGVGGEGLLETGDSLINTINKGSQVAENYALYARTRAQLATARIAAATGFLQEATQRIDNLRTYIDQAGGWSRIAETFLQEGLARIAEIDRHLAEAAQYQVTVTNDIALSDRFRTEGQLRLTEFRAILKDKAEYRKRVSSIPVRQPA